MNTAVNETARIVGQLNERFSAERQQLPGSQEAWVRALRQSAMDRFGRKGLPTTRSEAWKYTDIRKYLDRLVAETKNGTGSVDKNGLAPFSLGMTGQQIVFVDGVFSPELSNFSGMPAGVRIESVASLLGDEPGVIEPHLHDPHLGGAFPLLNSALMSDGAYIEVANGRAVEQPVHLLLVSTGGSEGARNIRNILVVGEQSELTVIEHLVSLGEGKPLTNVATDVELYAGGRLEHYQLQESSVSEVNIGSIRVHQHRDSYYHSHSSAFGSALSRRDIHVEMNGEGSECLLNGLYLVDGRQHVDHHTRIDHLRPNCRSRESYKGVIGGRGRAVFNGKVVVHKGADGTDSAQSNANLLLSDKAEIDTKPDLEIHADDVKCAHGATVGQLDINQLFYLRSRGLSEAEARNVLMFAFADEVLAAIRVPELRTYLEKRALEKLPHGEELEGVLG